MKTKNNQRKENIHALLLRLELWFAPILILVPVLVSLLFLYDWYVRGFSSKSSIYDGELLIALSILVGNLFFDIPFLKSLRTLRKKE